MSGRIFSYPPIADEHARILVLGTMPSVESLRQGFYYAHPRNAFWKIIAEIFGEELPVSVEDKKQLLHRNHIALWDTLYSCEREGSLDGDILHPEPNDILALLAACPQIQKICFNGAASEQLFYRHIGRIEGVEMIRLPSMSPAYTLAYSKKLAAWKAAIGGENHAESY